MQYLHGQKVTNKQYLGGVAPSRFLKGLYDIRIQKVYIFISTNSATLVRGLCLVLQLSHIQLTGIERRYRAPPMDKGDAVPWGGKKQTFFLISDYLFKKSSKEEGNNLKME